MPVSGSDAFLGLLAIIFPPIAVWIKTGICSLPSLLNLLLCMLAYVPGLIHAWYIIASNPDQPITYEQVGSASDPEGAPGQYHYYVVHGDGSGAQVQGAPRQPGFAGEAAPQGAYAPPQQLGPGQGYGTVDGGEGSHGSGGVPPTYEEAIRGNNKVQTP